MTPERPARRHRRVVSPPAHVGKPVTGTTRAPAAAQPAAEPAARPVAQGEAQSGATRDPSETDLPEQTADDTDAGWGEPPRESGHEAWLKEQRPPHWD